MDEGSSQGSHPLPREHLWRCPEGHETHSEEEPWAVAWSGETIVAGCPACFFLAVSNLVGPAPRMELQPDGGG